MQLSRPVDTTVSAGFSLFRCKPMNDYKVISIREFRELLGFIRGAKIVTLVTLTRPRMKKGGPVDLFKISRVNGIIHCDYSNVVNNQREREGTVPDFEALPRSWGTRLRNSPFVSHVTKDGDHKLYLEVKVQKVISTEYKVNCTTVSYEDIKKYLYENRSNGSRQQLEKEIVWRDYDVNHIISIDIDGAGYILKKA